jgi:hypothetical protein
LKEGVMPGSFGTNPGDNGVVGQTTSDTNAGVNGRNDGKGFGVFGFSRLGAGVEGHSDNGDAAGVVGFSTIGTGVRGTGKTGVAGQTGSDTHAGINGRNDGKGFGVFGFSQRGAGVEGHSAEGTGVVGFSQKGLAGRFQGDVEVTGDIRLANADCAEDFTVANADRVEPGTVMVLGESGILEASQFAFDKRVAGVLSGAGDYKPGIVLDRQGSQQANRRPVALLGKVCCKVDAQYGAVEIGDLLTTSPTPGHAMKAADPVKAFGAVIGKALRPLKSGQGLIPILVALQ